MKNLPANAGDVGLIPSREDALEKGMATHSSILAWDIPWTEESGGDCKEKDTTEQLNQQPRTLLQHKQSTSRPDLF